MEKTKTVNKRKTIIDVKKSGKKYEASIRIQVIVTINHRDRFSISSTIVY